MKETRAERVVFQGDLMVRRVPTLPRGAREAATNVVAHSETGHHHVAQGGRVWDAGDPLRCYVTPIGDAPVDLVHQRTYDTHETLRLLWDKPEVGEVVYEITRQREWVPEGWRRVED